MYNAMMRKTEVTISGISFFVAPFPVFTAARITASLSKVLSPVLGGLLAILGGEDDEEDSAAEDTDISSVSRSDVAAAMPAFVEAFNGLNPLEFERLMRELLINSRNIAWKSDESPDAEILTEEVLDALFAGNVQDMYILAFHVLKCNFGGFFEKFKNLSGNQLIRQLMGSKGSPDTGDSTDPNLTILSSGATH